MSAEKNNRSEFEIVMFGWGKWPRGLGKKFRNYAVIKYHGSRVESITGIKYAKSSCRYRGDPTDEMKSTCHLTTSFPHSWRLISIKILLNSPVLGGRNQIFAYFFIGFRFTFHSSFINLLPCDNLPETHEFTWSTITQAYVAVGNKLLHTNADSSPLHRHTFQKFKLESNY